MGEAGKGARGRGRARKRALIIYAGNMAIESAFVLATVNKKTAPRVCPDLPLHRVV